MQKYNAIVVFNKQEDKMLMCKRRKNPYKGLLNFVGGKREQNESGLDAAYIGNDIESLDLDCGRCA